MSDIPTSFNGATPSTITSGATADVQQIRIKYFPLLLLPSYFIMRLSFRLRYTWLMMQKRLYEIKFVDVVR